MLAILSTTKNQIANIWIVTEKALATHSSALACKNPMDGGAWPAVHGVAKSRTRLSDFTLTFQHNFPVGSDGKESACYAGSPGLIPGSGRSPGEGNGNSLKYSCLENSMDRKPGRLQSMRSQRVRND